MDFFVSCCNGWTPCTTFLGPGLAARPSLNRKSQDIHMTIGIIGESYGSYASFFPQHAIHGILRHHLLWLAVILEYSSPPLLTYSEKVAVLFSFAYK
jgi:hypothetical protein